MSGEKPPCRVRDALKIVEQFEAGEVTVGGLIQQLRQSESKEVADALEKISQAHLAQLIPFQKDLLYIAKRARAASTLWHLLQVLGKMTFEERSLWEMEKLLLNSFYFSDSTIVRTNVLQAAIDLAQKYPSLQSLALRIYKDARGSDIPALRAKALKLEQQKTAMIRL